MPAALLDGHKHTGVTVLFTVKALDAGNIILQEPFEIGPEETAHDLTSRLFKESGPLLIKSLEKLKDPNFAGEAQDVTKVTLCRKIAKTDGAIDWSKKAKNIWQEYKAFQPWPGIYTERAGVRVVLEDISPALAPNLKAGEFFYDKAAKALLVGTGEGQLAIKRLKSAGSKSMDAASYWNGLRTTGHEQFVIQIKD